MLSYVPIMILLVCFVLGIPIVFSMFCAVVPYLAFINTSMPAHLILQRVVAQLESSSTWAIHLFIMAGSIMSYAGISQRLMNLAEALVGQMRGGLAQVNVLLSTMMGGLSGSAAGDAASECKILVPEMLRHGYDADFSAAPGHPRTRRRIGCQPVRFDKAGFMSVFFQKIHCRIESLHMTDAENDSGFGSGGAHGFGFFKFGSDRFFHEDMFAHFQQRDRGLGMVIRRNRHAEGVTVARQFLPGIENFEVEFRTDPLGGILLNVKNTDHFCVGTLSVQPGMMSAQSSGSDDSDFQFRHIFHDFNPFLSDLIKNV